MVDTAPLHVEQGRIRGARLHVEATVEMRALLLEHTEPSPTLLMLFMQ